MKNKQIFIGIALLIALLISGKIFLVSDGLYFRLLIGLGFGYALTRASMGFAGGVNRLARTGSSTLATSLMIMFFITSIVSAFFLYGNEASYSLKINPINMALVIGGIMFGFGMALSSCCATGSLTDLSSSFSRAIVAVFFLCFGVFMGFRWQMSSDFVRKSYFTSSIGETSKCGVFLPDLFIFDGLNGYLGAIIFSAILTIVMIYFAKGFEKNYYKKNMLDETKQETSSINAEVKKDEFFEIVFVKPWKMRISVVIITLLFGSLLFLYEKGWGASTAFGLWFAKLLMFFGVNAEVLSSFTHKSVDFFNIPLLAHGTTVQNISIILGAFFYLLLAGKLKNSFKSGLKITIKDFFVYAFGGFLMGFSTRLSHGCNVGALYTPIAEFSLSGWLYLITVVSGGFLGNYVLKNYVNKTCSI